MARLVWKDEFNINVDYIDNAHQKLVGVLNKAISLIEEQDYAKTKHACIESIKFLKTYTVQHFAQEEDYQLKIGYAGYAMHKAIHDNLRENVLPALEEDLEKQDFSKEAVTYFLSVFTGWLFSHILIEDRAIIGTAISRYNKPADMEDAKLLDMEFTELMKNLFGVKATLVDSHYQGQLLDDALYYLLDFDRKDAGSTTRIVIIGEKKLVTYMIKVLTSGGFTTLDKNSLAAYFQLAYNCALEIMELLYKGEFCELKSHRIVDNEELNRIYAHQLPEHGIIWRTDYGRIGCCVLSVLND